jgi:hypothetical protein
MAELSEEVIAFLSEGTRNGAPGELVVRVQPTKVNATFRVSG